MGKSVLNSGKFPYLLVLLLVSLLTPCVFGLGNIKVLMRYTNLQNIDVESYEDSIEYKDGDAPTLDLLLKTSEPVNKGSPPDPDPEIHLTTPELLQRHGYPAESHQVTTQDGFILTLHRIPHGKHENATTGVKPVIMLHHGLMCSSSDWLMNTEEKALGYRLADAGYDVWLANVRGNTYSRQHISLKPDDAEFWNYSFHEVGVYDVPAEIDYILATTGRQKIHYIGHSMGTVAFWIAMSTYPHYNAKIISMFALGPVAFLNGTVSPIRHFADIATELKIAEAIFGQHEFLPNRGFISELEGKFCKEEKLTNLICENIVFLLCGYDRAQLNASMVPVILGHNPAGTSTHTIIHFLQLMKSGKFRQFDFGRRGNVKKYGSDQPPEYDLSQVTAKVALFYGQNDWLAVPGDVLELATKLPNVILTYKVKLEAFNHLDFLYAIDINKLLYDDLFELLRKF